MCSVRWSVALFHALTGRHSLARRCSIRGWGIACPVWKDVNWSRRNGKAHQQGFETLSSLRLGPSNGRHARLAAEGDRGCERDNGHVRCMGACSRPYKQRLPTGIDAAREVHEPALVINRPSALRPSNDITSITAGTKGTARNEIRGGWLASARVGHDGCIYGVRGPWYPLLLRLRCAPAHMRGVSRVALRLCTRGRCTPRWTSAGARGHSRPGPQWAGARSSSQTPGGALRLISGLPRGQARGAFRQNSLSVFRTSRA